MWNFEWSYFVKQMRVWSNPEIEERGRGDGSLVPHLIHSLGRESVVGKDEAKWAGVLVIHKCVRNLEDYERKLKKCVSIKGKRLENLSKSHGEGNWEDNPSLRCRGPSVNKIVLSKYLLYNWKNQTDQGMRMWGHQGERWAALPRWLQREGERERERQSSSDTERFHKTENEVIV